MYKKNEAKMTTVYDFPLEADYMRERAIKDELTKIKELQKRGHNARFLTMAMVKYLPDIQAKMTDELYEIMENIYFQFVNDLENKNIKNREYSVKLGINKEQKFNLELISNEYPLDYEFDFENYTDSLEHNFDLFRININEKIQLILFYEFFKQFNHNKLTEFRFNIKSFYPSSGNLFKAEFDYTIE